MIDRAIIARKVSALMKRAADMLAARREQLLAMFLWSAVAGVILLPALSQIGYPVWSLEYVLTGTAAIAVGAGCYLASRFKAAGVILIVILTVSSFLLYFGAALLNSFNIFLLAVAGILIFMAFAVRKFEAALRISGFAALAQIIAAAFTIPSPVDYLVEREAPRPDSPSVIHLLLDGHAGIAAFPESAVSREEVKQLEKIYLSRGFTIFRRAYSAETGSHRSLARLFNPTAEKLPVERSNNELTFFMTKAQALEQISRRRTLDLTFTNWIDLRPAVRSIRNLARLHMVEVNEHGNAPGIVNMPVPDRLWVMAAGLQAWFMKQRSPLAVGFFSMTRTGRHWAQALDASTYTGPLTARSVLQSESGRLDCCGKRGTYTFAHLIFPHEPYLFSRNCDVRPPRAWESRQNMYPGNADAFESHARRWRRHFEQVYCAASDVARLVDTVHGRKELADATIIVHGDHGSRIAIEDYADRNIDGYDRAAHERDWRATFFAVRIPGTPEGQVIETPVRIDDIYKQLLENDFRGPGLKELRPRADSPYPNWTGPPGEEASAEDHG